MNVTDYRQYDGLGLAELIRNKETTPKEIATAALAVAEQINPMINAIIELYHDKIDAMAHDSPTEANTNSPFYGVPFLRKDLFLEEAGRLNENGSRLWQGYRSEQDSWLTTRFKRSGINILGRAASPEMGLSGTTESVINGNTRNPYDLSKMAGGSSGGSAASVAAGIVPLAHASDGAGSIRIPASACNLVGLKPTRGRINPAPPPGLQPFDFSVDFVVSRTVRDSAAMLDAVQGHELGTYMQIAPPERPYLQELDRPLSPLRIAFTHQQWGPMATEPELVNLVEQTAAHLESAGHHVTPDTLSYDYEQYLSAMVVLWSIGIDRFHDEAARDFGRQVDASTLESVSLAQYKWAKTLTYADYQNALDIINRVNRQSAEFFTRYDLLLTPTLSRVPQPIGYYSQNNPDLNFTDFFRRCDDSMAYMPLANFSGQPAISLPLGMSDEGLPLGAQFIGRFGDEATLLRLAAHFEKATPWINRQPNLLN